MKIIFILLTLIGIAFAEPSIEKLNSEDFRERVIASKELDLWTMTHPNKQQVKLHLIKAYKTPNPEVKMRVAVVLKKFVIQQTQEGFLGISFNPILFNDKHGIQINSVLPDTPAKSAGLEIGDIISAVNNVPVKGGNFDESSIAFSNMIKGIKPYSIVNITVVRNGEILLKTVIIGYRLVLNYDNSQEEQKFFKEWLKNNVK